MQNQEKTINISGFSNGKYPHHRLIINSLALEEGKKGSPYSTLQLYIFLRMGVCFKIVFHFTKLSVNQTYDLIADVFLSLSQLTTIRLYEAIK